MESLHVASKYEIEYAHTTCSPNRGGSLYSAFDILGADPNVTGGSDVTYPGNFECPVESFDEAIEELKEEIADPEERWCCLQQELDALGMTAEELLNYMERFRKEADTRDGFLHFFIF